MLDLSDAELKINLIPLADSRVIFYAQETLEIPPGNALNSASETASSQSGVQSVSRGDTGGIRGGSRV